MVAQWKECSPEQYAFSLECLPPQRWSKLGFLVGEPSSRRKCRVTFKTAETYPAFSRIDGQTYQAIESITEAEFCSLTQPDICAAIVPAHWPVATVMIGEGWATLATFAAADIEGAQSRCRRWIMENVSAEAQNHPALRIHSDTTTPPATRF